MKFKEFEFDKILILGRSFNRVVFNLMEWLTNGQDWDGELHVHYIDEPLNKVSNSKCSHTLILALIINSI